MLIRFQSRYVDFIVATKFRYYDIRADAFVNVKPGIRLLVTLPRSQWVLSNKGLRRLGHAQ